MSSVVYVVKLKLFVFLANYDKYITAITLIICGTLLSILLLIVNIVVKC